MPGAQKIGANVFATPQQIACGFFLLGWDVNDRQCLGAIENGQLRGIAAVRLHAIARTARNQRRRNDVTRHAPRGQEALQCKSAGSRFITTPHRPSAAEPLDEPPDRREVRRHGLYRGGLAPG
jgi:hypothetical protein